MIDPRFVLMLTGLSARRQPGVRYDLYLTQGDTPPARLPVSQRAGRLDFARGDARVDVTAVLHQRRMDTQDLTLSILPDGVPDRRATPRIGALAIVLGSRATLWSP